MGVVHSGGWRDAPELAARHDRSLSGDNRDRDTRAGCNTSTQLPVIAKADPRASALPSVLAGWGGVGFSRPPHHESL